MPELPNTAPRTYQPAPPPNPRRVAAQILRRPGVRMGMLLSSLLFLSVWVGSIYLVENTWYALDWVKLYQNSESLYHVLDVLLYVVDGLVILFFGIPLIPGWIRYMLLAATGTTPPFSILFYAYANRKIYRRTMLLTFGMLWRVVLVLAAFALATLLAILVFALPGVLGYTLMVILAVAAAAILIFGSIHLAGTTMVIFLDINHPTASVRTILSRAKALLRGEKSDLWLTELFLFPHVLLGVLTFGVYMTFHTIPLYFTALQQHYSRITGEHLPVTEIVLSQTETK